LHLDDAWYKLCWVRTTVDLDAALPGRAKRLALSEGKTLGAVLSDAWVAYLGRRKPDGDFARFAGLRHRHRLESAG
jgi:hypothetical protein